MIFKASKRIKFDCHPIFSKWAKPNIYGSGKLFEFIKDSSKLQHRSTGPALLTYNPSYFREVCMRMDKMVKPENLTYKRHIIDMPDGGKVCVDEISNHEESPKSDYPSLLYCTGGADHSYTARSKVRTNWFLGAGYPSVFIVNRRCCGRVQQYSPQITVPYGKYNDLPEIVDYLVEMMPERKWILIGSCFGAQNVLDYFSQSSSNRCEVLGGIVDSFQFNGKMFLDGHYTSRVPFFQNSRKLILNVFVDATLNHAVNKTVYDQVSELVDRSKFDNLDLTDKSAVKLVNEELICKMCPDAPFSTQEEYYAMTSPYYDENHKNFLRIKKPLVLVYAQDDPFSPFDLEMVEILKENPNLCLWLYPGSGHIIFTERLIPYSSYLKDVYLENAALLVRKQGEL